MEPYGKTFTRAWDNIGIEMVLLREWNLHTSLDTNQIRHIMALIKRRYGRWTYDREHSAPPS